MAIKHFICTIIAVGLLICVKGKAQDKYFTKAGKIEFAAIKHHDVNALSRSAIVAFDTKTGEFQFSILVKSFEFNKAYMQEKFNNQILESDQFPKAMFKGNIENPSSVNYQKDGNYPVQVKGELTMHGITKDITARGTLSISKGIIVAKSTFTVLLDDYNISNPGIGDGNISIAVDCNLELIKN
ncbi:MAG: YceI family protein [Bacteroidota bacterium]